MSDRYIPREGPKLEQSLVQPTGPRSIHIIDMIILKLKAPEDDMYTQAVEIWRTVKRHSICDMGD